MIKIIIMLVIALIFILQLVYHRTTEKFLQFEGRQRSYLMHTPPDYSKDKQYPLVIMLHGYSDYPRLMEFYTGMSRKADKEDFIVIYPKGTSDKSDKNLSWNVGFCCGDAKRENVDDVAFIDHLLNELNETYSIDPKRIYVVGFSNGAMLAHKLGAQLTSKITAIAAISGTIGGGSISLAQPNIPLPVLIMHGKNDQTIPFDGGKNKDGDVYQSVKNAVDFWERSKSEVVLHTVDEGGHTWFGGKQDFFRNIFNPSISATDAVWIFFMNNKTHSTATL